MTTRNLTAEILGLIESAITRCYPDDWSEENFITRSWLRDLRENLGSKPIHWPNGARTIFDCQKLSGTLETNHGDIGFLVRISGIAGKTFTGFASLEAKRSYPGKPSDKYHQLDIDQLERQAGQAANHRLALYSHDPVTKSPSLSVHGLALPAYLAVLHTRNAAALEASSASLGLQVMRYLCGWDLDFSETTIDQIIAGDLRFGHLVRAHVGIGRGIDVSLNSVEVASGAYLDLDDPDIDVSLRNPGDNTPPMGGFDL